MVAAKKPWIASRWAMLPFGHLMFPEDPSPQRGHRYFQVFQRHVFRPEGLWLWASPSSKILSVNIAAVPQQIYGGTPADVEPFLAQAKLDDYLKIASENARKGADGSWPIVLDLPPAERMIYWDHLTCNQMLTLEFEGVLYAGLVWGVVYFASLRARSLAT